MGDAYADIPKNGGDFAKAVAVCIGSRACEQSGRGVMCPSYRISGNTALSTGGRVKLLKAALNDEWGDTALDVPGLVEAMDLCVSCKGCKRECENEVDMALIKVEYLAQRFRVSGVPPRNRLFAMLPQWLGRMPFFAGLIRLRNQSPWLARCGERMLGISAGVKLPEPASQAFRSSAFSTGPGCDDARPELVLFVDTFNRHFNPAAAEAAVTVLGAAGYRVHLPDQQVGKKRSGTPLCCGRTYLANGMIEKARSEAKRLLDVLLPHVQAGRWVIGLEPSCILSLRDEYLKLGLGDGARQLAGRVLLFEEFIARELAAKRWNLAFSALTENKILVHGHCHQKAVGATKAMRKVLKLIPELNFEMIESSCCGMAGQFGLEAEHAEFSRQMAEQGLFPALRAQPEAAVITNGFSCHQQICNGGFARPRHLAQLLYAALGK